MNPMRESARIAACAPGPGLLGPLWPPGAFTFMCSPAMPCSLASSPAFFEAIIAAVGDDSILWDFTTMPPDPFAMVSVPVISVM